MLLVFGTKKKKSLEGLRILTKFSDKVAKLVVLLMTTPAHDRNIFIKFRHDITTAGLIRCDESACRDEVQRRNAYNNNSN